MMILGGGEVEAQRLLLVSVRSSDRVVPTSSSSTSRNLRISGRQGDEIVEGWARTEEGREDDVSAPNHFLRGWPR